MASLGHIAIGLAATRAYGTSPEYGGSGFSRTWIRAALLWSALSFLPDADVIGFSFGVQYGDEWGHRGATHSLAFSFALGAAIGLAAPLFRLPALRTGLTAILVLTSHALLDTLTNGGLGCALFWPFDLTRYFAPWRPIPVSPIGLAFFSPYGMFVAVWEALMFAPVWWFAFSEKRLMWGHLQVARNDSRRSSHFGWSRSGSSRPPTRCASGSSQLCFATTLDTRLGFRNRR